MRAIETQFWGSKNGKRTNIISWSKKNKRNFREGTASIPICPRWILFIWVYAGRIIIICLSPARWKQQKTNNYEINCSSSRKQAKETLNAYEYNGKGCFIYYYFLHDECDTESVLLAWLIKANETRSKKNTITQKTRCSRTNTSNRGWNIFEIKRIWNRNDG